MHKFVRKYKFDIAAIAALLLAFPLFFFKLGQSSLVSWDEAWYAGIAANILKTGDIFRMVWNGLPFFDHPPFGFWLMALTFKLFGTSDFWARVPSASFGLLTLVATYFLGKELFGRIPGFLAAIALVSSPWIIYRSRSGNLDIFLTFLFVISLYFALKAQKDKNYLYLLSISLAFLLLTKTLIPFAIFPVLLYVFWKSKKYTLLELKLPIVIAFIPFFLWVITNATTYPDFVGRYFFIGTLGVTVHTSILQNINLIRQYLHDGVGIWFWPAVFSFFISFFLKKRNFNILLIFFLTFIIPFIFSPKGQIWHYTPLHPILLTNLMGVSYFIFERAFKNKGLIFLTLLIPTFYFAYKQEKGNWYGFIDIPAYVSDEAILSREAAKYPEKFYIDDDFVPAAAFYSGKVVTRVPNGSLLPLFQSKEKFILITKQFRLDGSNIKPYQYKVIKIDRDKILLQKI